MAAVSGAGAGAAYSDLRDKIVSKDVCLMNVVHDTPSVRAFTGDPGQAATSDADAQMIFYFPFSEPVKIYALSLNGPKDALPTSVKLFVNRTAFGFDNVDDEPTQELKLTPADFGGDKQLRLKFAKFQSVTSVHMLVDNPDADKTALSLVRFIGAGIPSADVRNIRKGEEAEA